MNFNIFLKFKINNEKSGIIICDLGNIESSWFMKNHDYMPLFDYDGVSYPVLGNKIYW
jgi:hypothetical protein